jgi:RNA polymerase sigma factor (TIGR02999 family)
MLVAMSDVTRILSAIEQGDPHAAEQLLPLVYDELRRLAAQKLAHEKPGQTLQATALVHEAYLRLTALSASRPSEERGKEGMHWNSRGHFFAAAAEAMRRILVEQARRRHADKRGGQHARQELPESGIAAPGDVEETLAIDDLLDRFATVDPLAANLVKLRFFVGLTMEEIAQALNISVRSAYDIWTYARSWLHRHLRAD